jgi:uncharacterized membrane protein YgcG
MSHLKPVLACALLLAAARADARELHWKSLDVAAQLDADGVLHVRERQHMVLTGDWNGGERSFRLEPGQEIVLHGMTRIDPASGAATPMREGSLDDVDRFAWFSRNVLRWRSREITDPEFDRTEIVYDLEYSLYGALVREGDHHLLAHDFAFADRSGVIEEHAVTLRIDPAWRVDGPQERTIRAGPLAPGVSHVVRLPLAFVGAGEAAVAGIAPRQARLLLALVAVPLLLVVQFLSSEWIRGRFAPLTPKAAADPDWLEANLLRHPAEVVGAVWDRGVGPDEVAALVARLAAEKKLETRVDGADHLHMKLLVDRDTLADYERALVDGFFFGGRDETSTADVRDHYRKTGFDPAAKIRPALEALADALVGPPARRFPLWLPTLLAFSAGMYLLWSAPGSADQRIPRILAVVVPAGLLAGFGGGAAMSWRGRIDRGLLATVAFWIPGALLLGLAFLAVNGFQGVSWLQEAVALAGWLTFDLRLAITLIALAFFNSIVNNARSRERGQGIALRKRLASARRFFERELDRAQPALRDEWFPYVLAFGLDDEAQDWFKAHGGESSARSTPVWAGRSSTSSSGGSSSGPTGWTGGGGAFGGAGASGSWALAASSLSAGVAAPSSSGSGSSSGGGGGGGGSSSGGGGGGGW